MMKHSVQPFRMLVPCVLLIVCAAGAAAAAGAADGPGGTPANSSPVAPAAKPLDTNAFAALTAKELSVDDRVREITARLIELNRSMQQSRSQAVTQDAEIKALAAEIDQKQAELEKKISEKYPKLGAMMREREQLVQEHSKLHVQLMDLRKQREEMAAGGR